MGMLFYFSVVSPSVRKISSISWFNLHLFTVKTLKVQVFLAHLGNFLEKHFNMLSTHTHTHTHTQHTHDLSVISSNKVKFSEPGLEWNLEPSLSCYVEWRGAIFVNISMCRVLFPYLYPTAQQGVQAEGMRENKKEL